MIGHRYSALYAAALTLSLSLSLVACASRDEKQAPAPARAAPAARAYSRASWRLADPMELSRTALWTSHILITHSDSNSRSSELRALDWAPDDIVKRSPAEAQKLIDGIMREARSEPAKFTQLARKHSEDQVTRDRGGSLGALWATSMPAAFLDALSAMKPGEVSHVVTTILGYHVILKRSPPPKEEVAGQHVVIRYQGTFGVEPSRRSRADALTLARRVTAEARAGADFAALVARYSEAVDRTRGGDMGVYTSTEPGTHSRVVEALAEVEVGQVYPEPLDSHFGFQVAKRVAVTPRSEYAARLVRFGFPPGDAKHEHDARTQAQTLAAKRRRDPGALRSAANAEPVRWIDGHGDAALADIIEKLKVGESTRQPERLHNAYAVAERIDPSDICAKPAARFDLPDAQWVDIEAAMGNGTGEQVRPFVNELRAFVPNLQLSSGDAAALDLALVQFNDTLGSAHSAEAVRAAYRANMASLRKQISEASYAEIVSGIQKWLMKQMLAPN